MFVMFNASPFLFLCRKDIYGVYSEPVDTEEVSWLVRGIIFRNAMCFVEFLNMDDLLLV